MYMQKTRSFLISTLIILICSSQKPATGTGNLQWISLEQARIRMEKEKRPILIDLYTDWCGWCREMDKKTYANPRVAEYLSSRFYTVRLNAETRENISWNNKEYHFNPGYRSNEFAVFLTNGRLQFPTTVFLPTDGSAPQAVPGFFPPRDFELIVRYFGDKAYGSIPFDVYRQQFKPSW